MAKKRKPKSVEFSGYGDLEVDPVTGLPLLPGMKNRSKSKTPLLGISDYDKMVGNAGKFISSYVAANPAEYRPVTRKYISAVTKGNTIAGMAPIVDPATGIKLQGFNYATPNFKQKSGYQSYWNKDGQYIYRAPRRGPVPTTKQITKAVQKIKGVDTTIKSLGKITQKTTGYVPSITPMSNFEFASKLKAEISGKPLAEIQAASSSSGARLSKISRGRASALAEAYKGSPYLDEANSILAQLGREPIEVVTSRRRRGRYRTFYKGGDPAGVLNQHNLVSAVTGWALKDSDIKPKYDLDMDTKSLEAEKAKILASGKSYSRSSRGHAPPPPSGKLYKTGSSSYTGNVQSGTKVLRGVTTTTTSYKVLTPEQYQRIQEIDDILANTGLKGRYSYYNRIQQEAQQRKQRYEKIADPLEGDTLQYASLSDTQLKELEDYQKNLSQSADTLEQNIDLLQEGVTKLKLQTGQADIAPQRKTLFDYSSAKPLFSKVSEKIDPITNQLQSQTQKVEGISSKLSELTSTRESQISARTRVSDLIDQGYVKVEDGKIDLGSAKETIGNKVNELLASAKALRNKPYRNRWASTGNLAGARSQEAEAQRLKKELDFLTSNPDLEYSQPVFAQELKPVVLTALDARRGKGHVQKIKVDPEAIIDGKTKIEVTYSWSPYTGRARAVSKALGGQLKHGKHTVVQELPVDEEGNVELDLRLTGYKKKSNRFTVGLEDIKVYKPTELDTTIAKTSSQLATERESLREVTRQHTDITQAKSFLSGYTPSLKTSAGVVAEVQGGELKIHKPEEFKSFFGDTGAHVFLASQDVGKTLKSIESRKASSPDNAQQLDAMAKFVSGESNKLVLEGKEVARRTQLGTYDIKDKEAISKLGVSLPSSYLDHDPTLPTKISALERDIESKQKVSGDLLEQIKTLGGKQIHGTHQASIDYYRQAKRKGIVSPGEAKKAIQQLEASKKQQLELLEKGEYFPDIDEFDPDAKSDAEQIREETQKAIKEGVRAKGLAERSGTVRPRSPVGSPVGAVLRRGSLGRGAGPTQTGLSSQITSLGGGSKNLFLKD